MLNKYNTQHGLMYSLINDVEFVKALSNGKIYEEDMVLENIIPKLNNINGNKVLLDVGGHIGSHSILYSKYVNNSLIYTFEPQKVLHDILKKNIIENNLTNINLFNTAVGHICGDCNMSKYLYDGYDCEIEYNTNKSLNYGGMQLGLDGEQIKMITIDSLYLDNCHYIKIDVEGAEPLVILGAIETIRKYKPFIMFECTDKYVNNEMKQSLGITFDVPLTIDILKKEGYNIIDIDQNNRLAIPF
jgi:FkbM family methyltransferase